MATKLRLVKPYDGWRFVFPPSTIVKGSVLRFEGSWEGGTRTYAVTRILDKSFNPKHVGDPTCSTDKILIGGVITVSVANVCNSARWAIKEA
jgi:hypothetical protein